MTNRLPFLTSIAIGALAVACTSSPELGASDAERRAGAPHASGPVSDHPIQSVRPSADGTMSSSGTAAAPGEIRSEGTAAMHEGLYPRGDALATERRPRGGPAGADAPQIMEPGPVVPRDWGATDQVD